MAEMRTRGATSGKPLPPLSESDINRFWDKVLFDDGCWLWAGGGSKKSGYGSFSLGPRATAINAMPHRVAYTIANGPIPAGLTVSHLCHNRRCVRAKHLVAEPIKANLGRSIVGEGHRDAKLNREQVRAMRKAFDAGEATVYELAKRYQINSGSAWQVVHRRTWRWLED